MARATQALSPTRWSSTRPAPMAASATINARAATPARRARWRGRPVAAALAPTLVAATLLLAGACRPTAVSTPATAAAASRPVVRLVAHSRIPTGTMLAGLEAGGLSGLAYDRAGDLFYAVSDD